MMRIFNICIALGILIGSSSLAADANVDRKARRSFQQGVSAFEAARLAEALDAFKRAYALRPSYRILYNIAQTEAEIGHPHRAVEAFEGYLADGGIRVTPKRKIAVEKEITRLRHLVGEIVVRGTRGAEVWLDGERKGYLPLAGPIVLPSGRHLLVTRHGSGEPCNKEILVKGGQRIEATCLTGDQEARIEDLLSPNLDSDTETAIMLEGLSNNEPRKRDAKFFWGSVAPWISTGLAVATLTAASICAWQTSRMNGELNESCPDGVCPPDRRDDMDTLSHLAGATDGLFVTGAVLSAAAVTLFIAPWKDKGESKR